MNSGIRSTGYVSKISYIGPHQIMATCDQSFSLTVNSYRIPTYKPSKENSIVLKKTDHHQQDN